MESSALVAALLEHDRAAMKPRPGGTQHVTSALTLAEAGQLLGPLLGDQRIRVIEVTEYASLRDFGRHIKQITDLLAGALGRRG